MRQVTEGASLREAVVRSSQENAELRSALSRVPSNEMRERAEGVEAQRFMAMYREATEEYHQWRSNHGKAELELQAFRQAAAAELAEVHRRGAAETST